MAKGKGKSGKGSGPDASGYDLVRQSFACLIELKLAILYLRLQKTINSVVLLTELPGPLLTKS